MEITADHSELEKNDKLHKKVDRIGIIASVLCAIHCALTPVLLIALPTFGKAWAHPATHWGMAIIVIPVVVFMMKKGIQQHGKKWILGVGSFGIICIIIGSILPYLEVGKAPESLSQAQTSTPTDPVTEQAPNPAPKTLEATPVVTESITEAEQCEDVG